VDENENGNGNGSGSGKGNDSPLAGRERDRRGAGRLPDGAARATRAFPLAPFRAASVAALACALAGAALRPLRAQEEPLPLRIGAVTFEGRDWIPERRLLEVSGLERGGPWSDEARKEALERLLAWPYLELVSLPREDRRADGTVDIAFTVRERLIVGTVSFQGNEAVPANDLFLACGLEGGKPYREDERIAAERRVLALYHEDGFLLARVRSTTVAAGRGRLDIAFAIDERWRVHIEDLRIEGCRQVPASEALRALEIKPRRLFGIVSRGYLVPQRLEEDIARLRSFYLARGYLSAVAGLESIDFLDDYRKVAVRLRVEEGDRASIAAVRLEGDLSFPVPLLEKELRLAAGRPYSEEEVEAGRQRLLSWYRQHSDIFPRIAAVIEYLEEGGVSVIYRVEERTNIFVGEVRITGNRRTRERVARRELAFAPGEHLDLDAIERSGERLRESVLFERVEVAIEKSPSLSDAGRELHDVEFRLWERERWGLFQLGGGASSGAGEIFYTRLYQPNFDLFRPPRSWGELEDAFRGGGETLDIELVPGSEETEYRFRFVEPYLGRSDLALTVAGSTSEFERRTYDERRLRGTVSIGKRLDRERRLSASLGFALDQVTIEDLEPDAPEDAFEVEGRSVVAYPRLEIRYEGLETNYYSGPAGFEASGQADLAERAFGSDSDFVRLSARADLFLTFLDAQPDYRHLLHVGIEAAAIESLLGGDAPLYERYYLGGPHSFRGFEYRRLGPHQGRTPVGGEGMVRGTVEYSLPLFWREVRGLALLDWGDLEPSFSRLEAGRFRTAVGGGLQVRLRLFGEPVPANFYFVEALSSEERDRERFFSFSVGIGF
jgi:outer membrane protein insertion porin family